MMTAKALSSAAAVAVLAALTSAVHGASKVVLVTEQEAALPAAAVAELNRRGITRGPQITVVSPPASSKTVSSPLHLQLKFESHGGAKIDQSSVKVTYEKNPTVDLTERVKPYIQSTGIDIGEADVPPGNHTFRVDVKDSDGRVATTLFSFVVGK